MKQSMLSSYLFQDLSKKKGGIIDGFGKKEVPGSFDDASSSMTFRGMAVLAGADKALHLRPVLNESSSLEDASSEGTASLLVNSNNSFCMTGDDHSLEEEIHSSAMEASTTYATIHSGITGNVGASLNLKDRTDHDGNVSNHHSLDNFVFGPLSCSFTLFLAAHFGWSSRSRHHSIRR